MNGALYTGYKTFSYRLAERIGGGGEGDVYAIHGDSASVVKVYKEYPDPAKVEKLRVMVTLASDTLLQFAAWPIDIVEDQAGRVSGFVMRKLEGYVPLHMLFTPLDRKKLFPDKGYNFLVHVARNLAVAFQKIHHHGIVVGDVNEANILVNDKGMVAMIDCDSFQIIDNGRYYYCEVGMLRYTPPEILNGGSFQNVIRTANTDNFSLASLIFQLLFLGRAPFTGINPGTQEIDEETAIKQHVFAYSLRQTNKKLFPPKNTLELSTMHQGLTDAFHQAFEQIPGRPDALKWMTELTELAKSLVNCGHSKLHFFPRKSVQCPWCYFKQTANIHYFIDDSGLTSNPELSNLNEFINGFKIEQLNVKTLSKNFSHSHSGLIARKIPKKYYLLKYVDWVVYVLLTILTIFLCSFNGPWAAAGIFALIMYFNFSPAKRNLEAELKSRRQAFSTLKYSFEALVDSYNKLPDLIRYKETLMQLESAVNAFKNLPDELQREKRRIEETHYQTKLNKFLQQFEVLYYPIPTFGPAKKKLIYNNGIRTAAEVLLIKKIKIPGIGSVNEQILLDWRRQVGAGFVYQPDQHFLQLENAAADDAVVKKKTTLESSIKKLYQQHMTYKRSITSTLATYEKKHEQLLPLISQADLDLKAFEKLK